MLAQYRFDQWTADNGLPQNSVYSIKQTRDGYLWLATVDGLARFDGVHFTVFNKSNSPGIIKNRFHFLFEANNGDLWAVFENAEGVVRHHQGEFTSFHRENGFPNIYKIGSDAEGNQFFVSYDKQIYRFLDEKFSIIEANPVSAENALIKKSEALHCYSLSDGQINCIGNEQFVKFTRDDGLPSLKIINVIQDVDDIFWVLTSDAGLIQMKKGKVVKIYTKADGLPDIPLFLVCGERISLVSKDKQGALWRTDVKTMRNELLSRNPPAPLLAALPNSPGWATVWSGIEDREGNIWIGTFRYGLFRIRKQIITAYSKAEGLTENNVYPIFEDRQGTIWIGTANGVFKYQNGTFTRLKSSENFYVDALAEDASGRLLISSGGALSRLEQDELKPFYHSSLGHILTIFSDRKNALWLGGDLGLTWLKDNVAETFTTAQGLAANDTKIIIDDRNGGLWIGGYGGLTHFKDGKFEKWTEAEGLPTPTIRSLYLDADNALWIGSYDSGMSRFKNGKFTHYTTKNGLYNDGAFQILEDNQQNFWISSNRGIYRIKKEELNELADGKRNSITSIGYGKPDGMLNIEGNGGRSPGGIKSSDGRLWFPTQDGVAVIDPSSVKVNQKLPPVVIEDIKIDDQSIETQILSSAVINPKTAIQIKPSQQNFEIQYTALSFVNSENLRFKYKLEGLDNDWIEAGTRRTAYFSHIPAGTYTFRVIAANSDGVWNEQGASIQITILPPFYRTWWFIVLSVLVIAAVVYFLFKRRIILLERQRLAQQNFSRQMIASQEQERKRIAAELHDSLGQRLVVVKNLAWMFLNAGKENEISRIEEISEEVSQALSEVKAISYNLRPYQLDRIGLTKAIEAVVRSAQTASGIDFSAQIDDIDDYFPKDAEINFYRIVQESVNNIIKHSQATKAEIRIERNESSLNVAIKDNGCGFNLSDNPPSAIRNPKAGGFGLIGIKERTDLLGGEVEIKSVLNEGTKIIINLERETGRRGEGER